MKKRGFLSQLGLIAAAAVGLPALASAEGGLRVATLHPLLTDIARQVGGEQVTVIGLMSPGDDVHHFQPSSSDIASIRGSNVLLASGKGLEIYLPKLQESLASDPVRVVQVGSEVRSIRVTASSSVFVCCPQHSVGSIDPHWWHSIDGMKKAVGYIAREFGRADPANARLYKSNAEAYERRLDALESWAKRELSRVPRSNRVLVTAHAAFGYFCREFGFRSLPVAGLSEESVSSQYLAEAIEQIREHEVRAIFPERNAKRQALNAITAATGVQQGGELIADGSVRGVTSYEAFVRHNIETIVAALATEPES